MIIPIAGKAKFWINGLGEFAMHALKPGGSLVAMSGQLHLPEVMERLSTELDYWWMLCLNASGPSTGVISRKVRCMWKPLLWFVRRGEKPKITQLGSDVFTSLAPDKDEHEWGQSESGFADVIDRMTLPGQVICDPFVGGGTVGAVSVRLGRYFIGADVERKEIGKTKKRLGTVKDV